LIRFCFPSLPIEDDEDIENQLEVIKEIYEMYDEIAKIPADEQLIQRFRDSFKMDTQVKLRDLRMLVC